MDKSDLLEMACKLSGAAAEYKHTDGLEASPQRDCILHLARQITMSISSPLHFTWTQITNMYALASLRTIMQLGVLQRIPSTGKISLEQLSKQSGVQASLLERLLRVLVTTMFITQDKEGMYSHTRISRAYGSVMGPGMMFQMTYDDCLPGLGRLHEYLAERKSYTEPDDQSYNPFTWARGQDGKTVWDIMASSGGLDMFQLALSTMDKKFPATGFFDFGSLVTEDSTRDVLVEVGGGIGRTLRSIIDSSPGLQKMPERIILQEIEGPANQAQKAAILPEGVRVMIHNMFEEQPVKKARAYYLRRVLHDYSDEKCTIILRNLAEAATWDTRILISEMMLPTSIGESQLPILCMDLSMMNMGGKERSEQQWRDLLTGAGLELRDIHVGFGADRLLEARLSACAKTVGDTNGDVAILHATGVGIEDGVSVNGGGRAVQECECA